MPDQLPKLRLIPLAGPVTESITLDDPHLRTIGRSSDCDIWLREETVSRSHMSLEGRAGDWIATDLGSRHGTFLNGVQLGAREPTPLQDGDLIRVGPWTFQVRIGEASRITGMPTTDDLHSGDSRVERVPEAELRSLAQRRLDLLIECAAKINAADTEQDLAEATLDAVISGTGFPRAAFVHSHENTDNAEIVAFRTRSGEKVEDLKLSRSLLSAARDGDMVRLESDAPMKYGESIAQLGIHSALCAPVKTDDESAQAFIYLDARNSESSVHSDAAAFCQAVARMGGLALANIRARDLRVRSDLMQRDLQGARDAQRLLLPPNTGQVGPIRYSMRMEPGRFVAGDLFDVVPLADGRAAVFLGDVTGKGAAASLLMATTQTRLNMALNQFGDPATAVNDVNRYLSARTADNVFISLWVGVFEPDGRRLRFVDAGHGHWLSRAEDGAFGTVNCAGGLPLAVSPDTEYQTETIDLCDTGRIVLFSDGLVEQPDPDGVQFGLKRAIEELEGSDDELGDVDKLVSAVLRHAQTDALSDDLTVASLALIR